MNETGIDIDDILYPDMTVKNYDKIDSSVCPHADDKPSCISRGDRDEVRYLNTHNISLGLNLEFNSQKIFPKDKMDKYYPEFRKKDNPKHLVDLKGQRMFFFVCLTRYNKCVQFEKTIDVWDVIRGKDMEDQGYIMEFHIWLMYLDRSYFERKGIEVLGEKRYFENEPFLMEGIWICTPSQILALPEEDRPIHTYGSRINQTYEQIAERGYNKKHSFLVDVRKFKEIFYRKI